MARTKQTARKSWVSKTPRKQIMRKRARTMPNGTIVQEEVEEDMDEIANTQQFSLKFDDQEKC